MKIDMSKTHSRVSWRVLMEILCKLGFSEKWRSLIFNCISSPIFSVIMNGSCKGFFKPSCGICQGDPLSSYLFILFEEVLSHMLHKEFLSGKVKYFNSNGGIWISHLLYVDYLLIFTISRKASIRNLMRAISKYERVSGQLVRITSYNVCYTKLLRSRIFPSLVSKSLSSSSNSLIT